jgi:hypothetical protein
MKIIDDKFDLLFDIIKLFLVTYDHIHLVSIDLCVFLLIDKIMYFGLRISFNRSVEGLNCIVDF